MNVHKLFIFIVCVALMGIPTHAKEVIDLDQYSTCDQWGFCKTEVDINELTLSKDGKDLLKDIETDTLYDLDTSSAIWNFQLYVQDREKLIVTGRITKDTYWTADFGDVFLDPWWNYTTYAWTVQAPYVREASSCGTSASGGNSFGLNFTTTTNQSCIPWVELQETETDVLWVAIVNNATQAVVANTTDVTDLNFSFASCVPLNVSTVYRLVEEPPTQRTSCSGVSFPYNTPAFSIIGGVYCGSGNVLVCAQVAEWFAFEEIGYQINQSTTVNNWYTTTLLLNHTADNLTMSNATALNVTALTNLTGLDVKIYVNGTLSADDTDRAENVTAYPCDYYNVTAFIGNASTNETTTYFANLTCGVASTIANYSYSICTDNETLYQHIAGFANGSFSYNDTYTYCPDECDNVTLQCEPNQYTQNLFNYFVVIVIIAGMALLYKFGRS